MCTISPLPSIKDVIYNSLMKNHKEGLITCANVIVFSYIKGKKQPTLSVLELEEVGGLLIHVGNGKVDGEM